jgi:hypothetical protein
MKPQSRAGNLVDRQSAGHDFRIVAKTAVMKLGASQIPFSFMLFPLP